MADDLAPHERALDDAVRAWVAEQTGGDCIVTGYVVVAASVMVSDANASSYQYAWPDQPLHVSLGLLEMAGRYLRRYDERGDD